MLRLGVVSFLNARPLIEGLDKSRAVRCVFDVPAALPGRLDRGQVDVALIPIVDLLRGGGRYRVVSDACIGCDGETMTVRVFSQVPPNRIETLWVDPDSHTSVALARVIWRELFERDLSLRPLQSGVESLDELESVLLIGDKVVSPRRGRFAYEVDLGGAWRQHTGLPFVFAVWAQLAEDQTGGLDNEQPQADGTRTQEPQPDGTRAEEPRASARAAPRTPSDDLADTLAQARDRGVARAAEIAALHGPALGWSVELARRYLTRCLTYRLDERSMAGVNRFARVCVEAGVVPAGAGIVWPENLTGAGSPQAVVEL